MIYRIIHTADLRGTLWGRDGGYPEWITAEQLYPEGPDRDGRIQRLVELGAIVVVPEE